MADDGDDDDDEDDDNGDDDNDNGDDDNDNDFVFQRLNETESEILDDEIQCFACLKPLHLNDIAALRCGHTFHPLCISRQVKIDQKCPLCYKKARKDSIIPHLYFEMEEKGEDTSDDEEATTLAVISKAKAELELIHIHAKHNSLLLNIIKQNFDAVNWAIILDEMVFANRELFEILFSTAIAERRALQMETIKEEKYRNIAEKLVLKRIELRQELYSQMNNYESLRAQINQTESNLTNLQKSIDVYDAEYWQLNDARHDLQMQIFQLQELFRQRRYCFHSFSKSSFSHTDKDDKDRNTNDKCLTEGQKNLMQSFLIIKYQRDNATIKKGKEVEKNAIEVAAQSEVNDKPEYKTFPSLGKLPGMKLPVIHRGQVQARIFDPLSCGTRKLSQRRINQYQQVHQYPPMNPASSLNLTNYHSILN
ncbi:hypothetical protein DINM_020089 [Dirofilaria immitis]|nr:hypothetical protein [Dirofilaria immitis]